MVSIKFNDDGVILYDLTPEAIGAVSTEQNDLNLDDLISQLIQIRHRLYLAEKELDELRISEEISGTYTVEILS